MTRQMSLVIVFRLSSVLSAGPCVFLVAFCIAVLWTRSTLVLSRWGCHRTLVYLWSLIQQWRWNHERCYVKWMPVWRHCGLCSAEIGPPLPNRYLTDDLPLPNQPLTDHFLPTTYQPLTNHLPTTYRPLTDHLPTTYRLLTNHLPTTYRPLTDHLPYGADCSLLPDIWF